MYRRRRAVGIAVLSIALAAATVVGTSGAGAAPGGKPLPPGHSKRVCGSPAAKTAACDAHVRTDANLKPLASSSYTSGYGPDQLRKVYEVGNPTANTTVAIVDAYANPNAQADLDAYRYQFGLGHLQITQLNQTGGTTLPAGDTGWGQEEMLDLEMVSAICPSCSIIYVAANSASFADLGAAVNVAAAHAKVVSNSYGGREFSGESTYAAAYNQAGVAITVSSGDNGYGVQVPAAYNTVTAVGGTSLTLNADGSRATETVWSGAGSGCSAYVSKPSWQKDKGCSRRTVADVSAVADPNTGVAVYDSYGSTGGANWYVFGGTSVAAPIIAGIYALSGVTSGNTPTTPAAWRAYNAPSGSLFDVISGRNGTCSRTYKYLCTGVSGYDGPTGVGTPKGTTGF